MDADWALRYGGDAAQAVGLLAKLSDRQSLCAEGLSPAACGLVQLKSIHALMTVREWRQARQLLTACRTTLCQQPAPQGLWQSELQRLGAEMAFAQSGALWHPHELHTHITALQAPPPATVAAGDADRHLLLARLHRRLAQQTPCTTQRNANVQQAIQHHHHTLLLALMQQRYGLVQTSLYELSLLALAVEQTAAGWRLLALAHQMGPRFGVPQSPHATCFYAAEAVHQTQSLADQPVFAQLGIAPHRPLFWFTLLQHAQTAEDLSLLARTHRQAQWAFQRLGDTGNAKKQQTALQKLYRQDPTLKLASEGMLGTWV